MPYDFVLFVLYRIVLSFVCAGDSIKEVGLEEVGLEVVVIEDVVLEEAGLEEVG